MHDSDSSGRTWLRKTAMPSAIRSACWSSACWANPAVEAKSSARIAVRAGRRVWQGPQRLARRTLRLGTATDRLSGAWVARRGPRSDRLCPSTRSVTSRDTSGSSIRDTPLGPFRMSGGSRGHSVRFPCRGGEAIRGQCDAIRTASHRARTDRRRRRGTREYIRGFLSEPRRYLL